MVRDELAVILTTAVCGVVIRHEPHHVATDRGVGVRH